MYIYINYMPFMLTSFANFNLVCSRIRSSAYEVINYHSRIRSSAYEVINYHWRIPSSAYEVINYDSTEMIFR